MKLIVSTCGTSLLTNAVAPERRSLIVRHANARKAEEVAAEERALLSSVIAQARQAMIAATNADRCKQSAEFNGLSCYYDHRPGKARDLHWLIATDTWLGRETAAILQETLESLGHQAQVRPINGLRTSDLGEFRLAMAALVRLCATEMRPTGLPVIFNLTGGFKSVQGFMQTLGMLYADETVYVFEGSSALLRLPRLPLRMEAEATVRASLRLFQRMAVMLPVTASEASAIPEVFLFVVDDQAVLSEWGEIVWAGTKDAILGESLWPPIDDKLRWGEKLAASVAGCSAAELVTINERLAELARHLREPDFNPRHLDFKKLAQPHRGYTHECDAWASGSAKRLFGHFVGAVFVVGELAKGLH